MSAQEYSYPNSYLSFLLRDIRDYDLNIDYDFYIEHNTEIEQHPFFDILHKTREIITKELTELKNKKDIQKIKETIIEITKYCIIEQFMFSAYNLEKLLSILDDKFCKSIILMSKYKLEFNKSELNSKITEYINNIFKSLYKLYFLTDYLTYYLSTYLHSKNVVKIFKEIEHFENIINNKNFSKVLPNDISEFDFNTYYLFGAMQSVYFNSDELKVFIRKILIDLKQKIDKCRHKDDFITPENKTLINELIHYADDMNATILSNNNLSGGINYKQKYLKYKLKYLNEINKLK